MINPPAALSMRASNALKHITIIFVLCCFVRCATNSSPALTRNGVLEEVREDAKGENQVASLSSAPNNPKLTRLMELLQSCGYEALGLQFEPDEALDLLFSIFSNVKTHNRQIRLIYTGLLLSYDARHRSITIGGTKDVVTVVTYIEKNIPVRAATERPLLPPPVWLTPSPTPIPSLWPTPSATPIPAPTPVPIPMPTPTPVPSLTPQEGNPIPIPTEVPSATPIPIPEPEQEKPSPPPLFDPPEASPQDTEI